MQDGSGTQLELADQNRSNQFIRSQTRKRDRRNRFPRAIAGEFLLEFDIAFAIAMSGWKTVFLAIRGCNPALLRCFSGFSNKTAYRRGSSDFSGLSSAGEMTTKALARPQGSETRLGQLLTAGKLTRVKWQSRDSGDDGTMALCPLRTATVPSSKRCARFDTPRTKGGLLH